MPETASVAGDATTPLGKGVEIIACVRDDLGGRGKGLSSPCPAADRGGMPPTAWCAAGYR
jgi:hypothetical protein